MMIRAIHWRLSRAGVATALLVSAAGCSSAAPPPETAPAPPTASATAASGGETVALEPGGLEVGTRYVIESLGVSIQPDVDGWFAVMPQGGDAAISRGDVTVYFLNPSTVLAPDGTRIPAPADPQALLDAIDASGIVQVVTSEPFDAHGISGLSAELDASGGSEDLTLLTTGTGEYGLIDGETQWIVLERDGSVVVVSLERPDEPDIAAAWEIAGPLVKSLDAAP
jgi:hypothetical protein